MLNVRLFALALASLSSFSDVCCLAATLQEDFSSPPALHGWHSFGDTNLFVWDATNQNLRVTWDSSRTNSYFYHSLGTILAKDDDFGLEVDLRLSDITNTTKSGPFEIAVGFLNLAEATATNFERGSGVDPLHGPRDIVEFDYFPSGFYSGFGDVAPSVSPTLVSGANVFATGFDLFELTNNDLFHIVLNYSATNRTLHTVITRNGAPFGPIDDVGLVTNFTDFRVDTVAISSYSDFGDDYDSVLAHGTVDNLVVTTPPPPVSVVTGGRNGGHWEVQFTSRTNWLYRLERTADFQSWTAASGNLSGNGGGLVLRDTNAPSGRAFYRVRAERP